jgi:hypothetical protein
MGDYYSLIARAISRLPENSDEARRAIYERARTALRERLCTLDPPITEAELTNEQAALDEAIGAVEVDFLFSEMRYDVRQEAALSPPSSAVSPPSSSIISRVKGFVRSIGEKFKMTSHADP